MSLRRFTFVGLAVISVLGLTSCDWSQFRFIATHSGDNETESAISTSNVSSLVLRFTATGASTGVTNSPAVVNGVVYSSGGNDLYVFDAAGNTNCSGTPETCAPLWTASISTDFNVQSSPAVVNGVVYVGSDNGKLYAFDAAGNTNCSGTPKTCAPLWTASTGSSVFSSPAVSNGVVYIGSEDGNLYAFDAAGNKKCSGNPKACAPLWIAPVGAGIYSSPAVSNGVVYVGPQNGNGQVDAFDASGKTDCSGGTPKICAPLWTYSTGSTSSSAAVLNGVLYAGDFLSKVYAFDAAGSTNCSGTPKVCQPLWTAGVNSTIGVISSPAVADGTVYVGDECNFGFPSFNCANPPHFYAFNAATGAARWTAINSSAPVSSSPGIANGIVYVGSGDGNLYAFDAAGSIDCSGTPTFCSPLWTASTGGPVGSPAIANGMVYVGSGDGKLYAFGLPQ